LLIRCKYKKRAQTDRSIPNALRVNNQYEIWEAIIMTSKDNQITQSNKKQLGNRLIAKL